MAVSSKAALSFRISAEDLAAIDLQAQQHRLTRTAFLIGKALDRLGTAGLDQRVDSLEQRLQRLEEIAYNT